jgi:vacuolar-type H+-ATPase subunit D/Vma8
MISKKVYLKRKREILHQVITKLEKELARVNRELKQLEGDSHGSRA